MTISYTISFIHNPTDITEYNVDVMAIYAFIKI